MDLTQLFKASVKTVRLRSKASPDKGRILKNRHRDDFLFKAKDVLYRATQLKDLLLENRPAYMRFGYHLKTATQMTESDRDIIDSESEKIILICNHHVSDLKSNILRENDSRMEQLIQHKLGILDILTSYLKNVYELHNEQKKTRIRHEMETLKLLKLRSNRSTSYDSKLDTCNLDTNTRKTTENKKKFAMDEDQTNKLSSIDDINIDDLQVLEFENCRILNDLKGLTDEVEQIEKHVTGIAKLQEIFTEKVNLKTVVTGYYINK